VGGETQVSEGQIQLSELEETKELVLELSHSVVVDNDVGNYKPKVVVEKKLTPDKTHLQDHKLQKYG